jgi:glucose-6-phosphate isomerase
MIASYRQTLSRAGLPSGYPAALTQAESALATLLENAKAGGLHGLTICEEADDLAPARALAAKLHGEAEHVVLLGVGGSSLGAQALGALKGYGTPLGALAVDGPRMHFLDNLDGLTMQTLLDRLPAQRTHFLAVSKSGTTAETMMQLLAVIARLKAQGLGGQIAKLVSVVTEPKDSPLTRLANAHGIATLPHPTDIGGRFSVFSIVGLLPALVIGIDASAVRAGAASVLRATRERTDAVACEGAAFSVSAAQAGCLVQVLMPYADGLERFAMWYRQLWAESLGKAGKGTLPVRALGPVDQHSQLQLYLEGPQALAFTLMTLDQAGAGPRVPRGATGDRSLGYIEGKAIGDLVMAEARATHATFERRKRPLRLFELARLDEAALGALMMHFMLETVLSAAILKVDPFDQPAVEEGKILARRYLEEMKP